MSELKANIDAMVEASAPGQVWVPTDFSQLGKRDAIDKTLQRMLLAGELHRVDRGLYDRPRLSSLTRRPTTPDYRAVTEAIARRDQLRLLVEGMTTANDYQNSETWVKKSAVPTNHLTYDKLTHLKLFGMARAFAEQSALDLEQLGFEKRFGLLVEREMGERDGKALYQRLLACRQRQEKQNVQLTDPTGVGKP